MDEYSFGRKPTADYCSNINIQCVYDENIPVQQP